MKSSIRGEEILARYGGDEFCIIIPEGAPEETEQFSQRLIQILQTATQDADVTCSIGVASSSPTADLDADELVKKADEAMYQAKLKDGFSIHIAI